jgi:predicted transcriptional regulator
MAMSKQTIHRFYMERFDLKKLNEVEVKKKSTGSKSQIDWQLWKSLMLMWILIELGKLLHRISKFHAKRVKVIMN